MLLRAPIWPGPNLLAQLAASLAGIGLGVVLLIATLLALVIYCSERARLRAGRSERADQAPPGENAPRRASEGRLKVFHKTQERQVAERPGEVEAS